MNRPNYQRMLDRTVESLGGARPRLLLHACCGPCSTYVLEYLREYFDITLFFYNPNIQPREEYDKRLFYLRRAADIYGTGILECSYDGAAFNAAVRGLESAPEGGARCAVCFDLRLRETAMRAREGGFEWFCSTLTVSRHKNAQAINETGERIARETGVSWLYSDFKKRGGCDRSSALAEEYGLYEQLWCGCDFSNVPRGESKKDSPVGAVGGSRMRE